ncbi:BglII/BstYI family type II restriction endonuclease [Sphingomonas sp.]|uniref:BglII/BstYI family type II restriction endonuclease n=1 Tax=Sphingomonas sp. TaxID=28214 RepID=UPI003F72A8F6
MKLAFTHEHRNGGAEWEKRDLFEWITDIFEAPAVRLGPGCTSVVRQHISNEFRNEGWGQDVKIDQDLNLTISAMKDDLAFQLQTGNISRAPYDLLKLQHLFQSERIEAAALALPTRAAAAKIGSNVANAERVCKEMTAFDRVITVPILLIAFE